MEFLQKYLFIPLDIFKESKQNRDISDRRDAWLTLFTSDEPDDIIALIEKYPEFRAIYEEDYEICLNVERVMEMFSKELYELDRNTVQYMIDEMQDTIDAQKEAMAAQKGELDKQKGELNKQKATISAQKDRLDEQNRTIVELQKEHENVCNKMYDQSINSTISILKELHIPKQEITTRICEQYRIDAEQLQKYL